LDVSNKTNLYQYFEKLKPDIVINCCGIVGSSEMNKYQSDFDILNTNILINTNILECCCKNNVEKLILFSTYRLYGDNVFEKYNELNINNTEIKNNIGYLFAKKVLHTQINLLENNKTNIICLILPNIFGLYDNFTLNGRIVPSLINLIL
jgi:nucleoside-diphosphate-sugar epimerase